MILFRLAAGLACVGLSVWGFVEALGGERWHLPLLGEYAARVPLGTHLEGQKEKNTSAPPN
jgi:hypothetical protein